MARCNSQNLLSAPRSLRRTDRRLRNFAVHSKLVKCLLAVAIRNQVWGHIAKRPNQPARLPGN